MEQLEFMSTTGAIVDCSRTTPTASAPFQSSKNNCNGKKRPSMLQRLLGALAVAFVVTALSCSTLSAQEGPTSLEPHDSEHAKEPTHWCGVHASRNELVKAFSDCTYALKINPNDAQAIANKASVYLLANDPKAALAYLEVAIKLRPQTAHLYYNRGLAYSTLGMSDKAIADYSETLRLDPKYLAAYHNRGLENERQDKKALAIQDYEAALAIDPSFQQSLIRLNALKSQL